MSDEKTLLSCPFCGGEAKVIQADHPSYTPHGEGWYVICKCGATLGYHGTDELYMTYGDFASKLEAIAAWNTRAVRGTLTAEQVIEAFTRHCTFYYDSKARNRESIAAEFQAFADELNAELGSGTCEQVLTDCDDGLMPPFTAHCSACGAEWGFTPKYCHNCGARVTGTRDERKAVAR